jgi:hypothetical protein
MNGIADEKHERRAAKRFASTSPFPSTAGYLVDLNTRHVLKQSGQGGQVVNLHMQRRVAALRD